MFGARMFSALTFRGWNLARSYSARQCFAREGRLTSQGRSSGLECGCGDAWGADRRAEQGGTVRRIFLTLAVLSNIALVAAFAMGQQIVDARSLDGRVDAHFGMAILALILAALVHAIVLTYFMGTGRWLDETTQAYRLPGEHRAESKSLKYRTVPAMVAVVLMLVGTGALGAAADPASPVGFTGWGGLSAATTHLVAAVVTLGCNAVVSLWEYVAIDRNGRRVQEVVDEVRRIRAERGLRV